MTIDWKRRLIPKWRTSTESPVTFGTDARAVANANYLIGESGKAAFEKAIQEFEDEPSLGTAGDALRFFAEDSFHERLQPIARFLLGSHASKLPSGIAQKARRILGEEPGRRMPELDIARTYEELRAKQGKRIAHLRRMLRSYPNNAFGWMDLARLQASVGNNTGAEKGITIALGLAPESRGTIRSAVRFFAHVGQVDRALRLLQRSRRTDADPWLLASEISVNSLLGKSSRRIKRARDILESGRFLPADTTELAGALAAEEIVRGSSRKVAKRLYSVSLVAPNDNALAQAQWAASDLGLDSLIPESWLENRASAEAALYRSGKAADFETAYKKALLWHLDEPFASRPMTAASHFAALSGKFKDAVELAKFGLTIEPGNIELLNNLTFSLLRAGEIEQAIDALQTTIKTLGQDISARTIANYGFLAYVCGEVELGRRAYEAAARTFEREGRIDSGRLARIYHAFAAGIALGRADARVITLHKQALDSAEKSKDLSIAKIASNLLADNPPNSGNPAPMGNRPTARSWVYDLKRNLLILE